MEANLLIALVACAVFFGGIAVLEVYSRRSKGRRMAAGEAEEKS